MIVHIDTIIDALRSNCTQDEIKRIARAIGKKEIERRISVAEWKIKERVDQNIDRALMQK